MAFPTGRPNVHRVFALVMSLRLLPGSRPPSSSGNGFDEINFHVNIISRIVGLCSVLLPSPETQKGHTTRMFFGELSLHLLLCKMANHYFLLRVF